MAITQGLWQNISLSILNLSGSLFSQEIGDAGAESVAEVKQSPVRLFWEGGKERAIKSVRE